MKQTKLKQKFYFLSLNYFSLSDFSTSLVLIELFSKKRKTYLADAWHSSLNIYFCNKIIELGSIYQFYLFYLPKALC